MTIILAEKDVADQAGTGMARTPKYLGAGGSTAPNAMIEYRRGKLQERGLLHGVWLDCGCADGGYTLGMLERGAERVFGVDAIIQRVIRAQATASGDLHAYYRC